MEINAELVNSLKKQDVAAFVILYDRYSPCLFGVILKNVPEYNAACTVLKESYISIWKNIGLYHASEGSLLVWMLRIAIRISKQPQASNPSVFPVDI